MPAFYKFLYFEMFILIKSSWIVLIRNKKHCIKPCVKDGWYKYDPGTVFYLVHMFYKLTKQSGFLLLSHKINYITQGNFLHTYFVYNKFSFHISFYSYDPTLTNVRQYISLI